MTLKGTLHCIPTESEMSQDPSQFIDVFPMLKKLRIFENFQTWPIIL